VLWNCQPQNSLKDAPNEQEGLGEQEIGDAWAEFWWVGCCCSDTLKDDDCSHLHPRNRDEPGQHQDDGVVQVLAELRRWIGVLCGSQLWCSAGEVRYIVVFRWWTDEMCARIRGHDGVEQNYRFSS